MNPFKLYLQFSTILLSTLLVQGQNCQGVASACNQGTACDAVGSICCSQKGCTLDFRTGADGIYSETWCVGTPESCAVQPDYSCTLQRGCGLGSSGGDVEATLPPDWASSEDGSCTGDAVSCDLSEYGGCLQQGCTLDFGTMECVGTPTSCSALDYVGCGWQDGCTWGPNSGSRPLSTAMMATLVAIVAMLMG